MLVLYRMLVYQEVFIKNYKNIAVFCSVKTNFKPKLVGSNQQNYKRLVYCTFVLRICHRMQERRHWRGGLGGVKHPPIIFSWESWSNWGKISENNGSLHTSLRKSERTISCFKLLKNYLRRTIIEERLIDVYTHCPPYADYYNCLCSETKSLTFYIESNIWMYSHLSKMFLHVELN